MALAYSEDLRKRAVSLIERGRKIEVVVKLLNVSRATLYRWISKKQKEGTLAAKKNWQKGYGNKISDLERFKQFVEENHQMTATEMAEKLGNISVKTMCKWLKRAGFTRKKKLTAILSETKKIVTYIWKK